MRFIAAVPVAALALLVGACESPTDCILSPGVAVEVAVRDSVTGAPAADGALGTLEFGGEEIPLALGGTDIHGVPLVLAGGSEPGRYSVRIEKSGYESWVRPTLRVESSDCGLLTERLEARLQPAGS
jgi:hypothetical protein